ELNQVIGQRAALDIAEGGMLTPGSFSTAVVPGEGQSVVGVALTPAQAPGLALQNGDHVRVVATPAQGEDLPAGAPLFSEADVVGVHVDDETGQTVVDLLVSHADAAVLATRVATGNVAIVLDSRER
ncbi:MAG: SAF domain-containing protein, partial [Acidimicrobiales bacterium]